MSAEALPTATVSQFFQAGGTLPPNFPSYVTRAADDALFHALLRGEFCYILTSRQMGKSSLVARTALRLRDKNVNVRVATIDLNRVGTNLTVEQWYFGLLERIGEELLCLDALEEFWFANTNDGPLVRFMKAIEKILLSEAESPLVIMVDEIDQTRSLPFKVSEFFAAIRNVYNRRSVDPTLNRLTFALFGVASPTDLIADPDLTPFNIGTRIELTDLQEKDASPLLQNLAHSLQVTPDEAKPLVNRILHWTGGHPYLTQRLCLDLVASRPASAKLTPSEVDALCTARFFDSRAEQQDSNLLFVSSGLTQERPEQDALLDLYSKVRQGVRVPDDTTDPLIEELRLLGIVRIEQ